MPASSTARDAAAAYRCNPAPATARRRARARARPCSSTSGTIARSVATGRCTLVKRLRLVPSAAKNGSSSLSSTIAPGRSVNSRPQCSMVDARVAGVARQAIAVVIGLDHLAHLAPHRGEGAVAAAEHGGADMDGIHVGAKRHVGAGSSSPVLEKCSNNSAKRRKRCRSSRPSRQHVGRQRFPDDGHDSRVSVLPDLRSRLAGAP